MGFYDGPGASREPKPGEGEEYELRSPDDARLYDLVNDVKILNWRLDVLEGLGLQKLHASSIAQRRDIDLEDVRRMAKAGATSEQIALILL